MSHLPAAPSAGTDRAPAAGARAAASPVRRQLLAGLLQRQGAAVVLALLVLGAWLAFPRFGTVDNLRDVALQSSFLAVIALGMTFVIITGGIDLSVGSVYALGGCWPPTDHSSACSPRLVCRCWCAG